jgi:DNA-binding CsgD family transcriptional regulator
MRPEATHMKEKMKPNTSDDSPEPLPAATTAQMLPAFEEELTPREREVLALIGYGKSTKETAVTLGIAFKTAVCHRTHIMSKLGTHNTADTVRHAIRMGLVEP